MKADAAAGVGDRVDITLRPMTAADLPAVRPLLTQLGYEIEAEEVRSRFLAVAAAEAHAVLVAEAAGEVVGFVHVFARPALEKPPEAIVQSLVVDTTRRAGRIGKALMTAVECWARERGFRSVALTSQVTRDDAHAFYERLGYRNAATSHLLRKQIGEGK